MGRAQLRCPDCDFTTRARYYGRPPEPTSWRHLDLGPGGSRCAPNWRPSTAPSTGGALEGVPFARAHSHYTTDFEDLVGGWPPPWTRRRCTAWCASTGPPSVASRAGDGERARPPDRLDRLFVAGVDEVAWRKGHSYITFFPNHATGKFVWDSPGKDTPTLDAFFDQLGPERSEAIEALSMDMGPAYDKSAKPPGYATKAPIRYDPFPVVNWLPIADKVRRGPPGAADSWGQRGRPAVQTCSVGP